MTRRRTLASLATALLLLGARAAAQPAAIEGVARADSGGAPVPFALVRLLRTDSTVSAQGITGADGRFRFGGVPAGRYRVQLLRIGFRPAFSAPVELTTGETAQLPLRVASEPLRLPAVTVTGEGCVTRDALAEHPRLLTLWQQARDGASIREGLMTRFHYRATLREESVELRADGPTPPHTPPHTLDQTWVNEPKSALSVAARRRAQRLARGYAAPNDGWAMPNELDVLHEDFLREHCFEPSVAGGDGEIGLRFRPRRTRRGVRDVGGTIWLDSASYLTRRLELDYVEDDEPRGTLRVDYGDVAVAGGTLRMPVGGSFHVWPSNRDRKKETEGKLTFSYSDLREVPPR